MKPEVLAVTIASAPHPPVNIHQFCRLSIDGALLWLKGLSLNERQELVVRDIVKELRNRLGFLADWRRLNVMLTRARR